MKLKGQLLWTDYLNAQLLHMSPGQFGKIVANGVLVVIGLCLIGGILLSVSTRGDFPIGLLIPGFFLVAAIGLYRYVFLPWRVKKIFFQQKELGLPFEMEITDTGLSGSNEVGNSNRPWANFTKWKEDQNLLLLYHSDVMFSMIPKRLFTSPEQVESIKALLEKNKVPAAKSRFMIGCGLYIVLVIAAVAMVYMAMMREVGP